MKGRTAFVCAGALAAAAIAAPALAGAPDTVGPWADSVVEYQPGPRADGSAVPAPRDDPDNAVGIAEDNTLPGSFVSLGFGGRIILQFENKICNGTGEQDLDLQIVEATNAGYPPERVDVYVSPDNVSYTLVASGVNKDATLGLPPSITVAQHYVKLVDVSNVADYLPPNQPRLDADAYDVDGVKALVTTGCPEKVGTGRMTGGGSLFLSDGSRVTHGFTLRCNDPQSGGNDLQVNWDKGNKFHLESISDIVCYDADGYDEGNPDAGFDTQEGTGLGRYNGASGYRVDWKFTDAGEPGSGDFGRIKITSPTNQVVLSVEGAITKGNQQAHNAG